MPELKDIILGNVAVERGIVTRETLLEMQRQQRDSGLPLGQVMLKSGVINGSRLIELMKLVNVTIQHLDGGLEVGIESTEESHPPAVMGRGGDPEDAPPPAIPGDIPVAPVVGGARPGPKTGMPASPTGTPRPMPQTGTRGDDGTSTPAPLQSPFEQTPRPVPPPTRGGAAARGDESPGRPKTEAFNFEQIKPYKPRTEALPAQAKAPPPAGAGKPATQRFSGPPSTSGRPGTQRFSGPPSTSGKPGTQRYSGPPSTPGKPGTRRFDEPDRPKTEAFDAQLVNDTPEIQGALGEGVGTRPPKKDKTRLYRPVDLPVETPAGKLPPEGNGNAGSISLPPKTRESGVPGLASEASTPAGRLPTGIDADSKPLASPLDDTKVARDPRPFEMPPGADAATQGHPAPPARPPRPASTAPTPATPGRRQLRPEDSGFIAASDLPDFEVRPGKPGEKAVVVKNPKHPTGPLKPEPKGKKGGIRSGVRPPAGKSASGSASSTPALDAVDTVEEAPRKKRRLWLWITFVVLLLALISPVAALLHLKRLTFQDLQDHNKVWSETLKLFEEGIRRIRAGSQEQPAPAPKPSVPPDGEKK